ncbi:hypothetical protein AAMO2058_001657200 [Amorphochlora amoebiformis]
MRACGSLSADGKKQLANRTALEYKSTKVIKSAFYARIGVVVVAGVPFPLLYGRPQERTLPRISSCSPPATDRTTSNKSRFASPGDGLSHCDLTSLYFTSMRSRASNTLGPEHLYVLTPLTCLTFSSPLFLSSCGQ